MKTFTALFLICILATVGYACTKPKPKPPEPPKCTQTQTQRQNQNQKQMQGQAQFSKNTNVNTAVGLGLGVGNARATGGNANVSIDIGDVSDAASQGGISAGSDYIGGTVWLDEVWRPNAMVTPWNPQVIPSIPVEPVQAPQDSMTPERTLGFWFNGLQFVLED